MSFCDLPVIVITSCYISDVVFHVGAYMSVIYTIHDGTLVKFVKLEVVQILTFK